MAAEVITIGPGKDHATPQAGMDWLEINRTGGAWPAADGIVFDIYNGTYGGVLNDVALPPTRVSPFVIQAAAGQTAVVIQPGGGNTGWSIAAGATTPYFKFKGFKFDGGAYGVYATLAATLLEAEDMLFTAQTYAGLRNTVGSTYGNRCKFDGTAYGIIDQSNRGTVIARNSEFIDCGVSGIRGAAGIPGQMVCLFNTFLRCGQDNVNFGAIALQGADYGAVVVVLGNLFEDSPFYTITFPGAIHNSLIDCNNYHSCAHLVRVLGTDYDTLAEIQSAFGWEHQGTELDPQFVSEVDGSEDLTPENADLLGSQVWLVAEDKGGNSRAYHPYATPGAWEGSYSDPTTPPDPPDITAAVDERDGSTATVTVAGVVNSCKVYSRRPGVSSEPADWTLQDTLSADGDADLTGLDIGEWEVMAQNVGTDDELSVPDTAPLYILGPQEPIEPAELALLAHLSGLSPALSAPIRTPGRRFDSSVAAWFEVNFARAEVAPTRAGVIFDDASVVVDCIARSTSNFTLADRMADEISQVLKSLYLEFTSDGRGLVLRLFDPRRDMGFPPPDAGEDALTVRVEVGGRVESS